MVHKDEESLEIKIANRQELTTNNTNIIREISGIPVGIREIMIDKSNMREVILNFPKQFEEAFKLSKNIKVRGKFDKIIICGMGGSALPANILIGWLNHLNFTGLPIYIHRNYNLPSYSTKKSLVICISYSGNTEEPVSVLKEAIKRKIKVIAVATGGKIGMLCQKNNIPWVKIPVYEIQPRSATGYLFTALATVLANSKIIKNRSKEILKMAKNLDKLNQEKEGKALAKKLINKIPLIYASNKFKYLARIWKIKFNENSKVPAFYNYFPELNHNEMVGFSEINPAPFSTKRCRIKKNNKFHIIILKDKEDYPRNLKRMKLFSELIKNKGIKVDFVNIMEGDILFKIFSTLVLGDWVSYYLALEYKIDPTPIKLVEEFKKKLEE